MVRRGCGTRAASVTSRGASGSAGFGPAFIRAAIRPLGESGAEVPRGAGTATAVGPEGAQPSAAAAGLQDGYGALPPRLLRAIHEQSGGADSADDKATYEDLGRVPLGAASEGFRHAVQRAVDGAEARIQLDLGAPTVADRSAHRTALLAGTSTRTVRLPATPVPGLGMPHRSGIRDRQIVGST